MARTLNINKAGNNIAFADSGLKLSQSIILEKIEVHEKFQKLFQISEELLSRITDSMKEKGFDGSQPLHIWIVTDDDGTVHYYLIDGYTRLAAAKAAGLKMLPYYEHRFNNFDDAYKYVLSLQVNRRNLGGNELLKNISVLMGTEFIQTAEGKKTDAIAEVLQISPSTVKRAIAVEKDKEIKEKVDSGEITINQGYKEVQKKKQKETKKDDDDYLSESLDDNSGKPQGLIFNHSDGIERPVLENSDKDVFVTLEEKNIQVEAARKEGYEQGCSDFFYKAVCFCLGETIKGRTPKDIFNDERISDLSPTVISKFELPEDDENLVLGL